MGAPKLYDTSISPVVKSGGGGGGGGGGVRGPPLDPPLNTVPGLPFEVRRRLKDTQPNDSLEVL